jgi:hypothetical protein
MGSLGGPCEDDGPSIDITRVDTYRQTHDRARPIGFQDLCFSLLNPERTRADVARHCRSWPEDAKKLPS